MKVLFLDIDGVCNSAKTFQGSQEIYGLDPYMCFLVGKIKLDTDCEVVLSSSWRHSPEGVARVEERIVKLLDTTGYAKSGFRGDEVREWLNRHPEVTAYAILDDNSDFHGHQHLFQTKWEIGLTQEIAEAVTNHLNQ